MKLPSIFKNPLGYVATFPIRALVLAIGLPLVMPLLVVLAAVFLVGLPIAALLGDLDASGLTGKKAKT